MSIMRKDNRPNSVPLRARELISLTGGPDQVQRWAQAVYMYLQAYERKLVFLSGPLGAGKTTLTAALMPLLGVHEPVTSPTFSYMHVYSIEGGSQVAHMDLYRLQTIADVQENGIIEVLDQVQYAVVEWPEIIANFYTDKALFVTLEYGGPHERTCTVYL